MPTESDWPVDNQVPDSSPQRPTISNFYGFRYFWGITMTSVAVKLSLDETVSIVRTLSPAQTKAKDGALTPCSLKVVPVGATFTV